MVGSADSIGETNTVLNTMVAEAFCEAADILEASEDLEMGIHDLIKTYFTEHQRIIFGGDGYSESWTEEARRRGLPEIKTMAEAAAALTTEKSVRMFEKFGIFTRAELESRQEIIYETYAKTINIEAQTMIEMAGREIIPACMRYEKELAGTVLAVREAGADTATELKRLSMVASLINQAQEELDILVEESAGGLHVSGSRERAFYYQDIVVPRMAKLRRPCDELEKLVDRKMWPFPTYGDLMFEV